MLPAITYSYEYHPSPVCVGERVEESFSKEAVYPRKFYDAQIELD